MESFGKQSATLKIGEMTGLPLQFLCQCENVKVACMIIKEAKKEISMLEITLPLFLPSVTKI